MLLYYQTANKTNNEIFVKNLTANMLLTKERMTQESECNGLVDVGWALHAGSEEPSPCQGTKGRRSLA
jgi:hypothetical protein